MQEEEEVKARFIQRAGPESPVVRERAERSSVDCRTENGPLGADQVDRL